MSQGGFCTEKVHYYYDIFFYCISVRASKAYFEYYTKKVVLCLSKSWQMTPWFEFGYAGKVHFLGKR